MNEIWRLGIRVYMEGYIFGGCGYWARETLTALLEIITLAPLQFCFRAAFSIYLVFKVFYKQASI